MILYQPANGYCYNSDTHFLYDFILENLKKFKNVKGELLDIGSGSGILGLLVSRDKERLNLNQCEIQESFQILSLKNAQCNGIETTMHRGCFLDLNFDKKFDICISNPPFYHNNVVKSENENLKIARYNDSLPLDSFIKKVSSILNSGGKFFFCYDVKQLNSIIELLNKNSMNIEALQFVHPKKDRDATLVLVYARKNSKSLLRVMEPLVVFEEEQFSSKAQEIYRRSSTYSIKVDI